MAYYAQGDGQAERTRAAAFELFCWIGGVRKPIMQHILILPQAFNVSYISADVLKLNSPGKHWIQRHGYVAANYQLSGKINQAYLAGELNGRRITGESAFKSLQDLWDCYQGKGRYAWRDHDGVTLPDGTTAFFYQLELIFTNLDEPESDGRAGEGSYKIHWQPNGGFTFRRQVPSLDYSYSFNFVALDPADLPADSKAVMMESKAAMEAAAAVFSADAAWALLADTGQRFAREAADAYQFRNDAKDAMASKPWAADQPADIPAGAAAAALAALDAIRAGVY